MTRYHNFLIAIYWPTFIYYSGMDVNENLPFFALVIGMTWVYFFSFLVIYFSNRKKVNHTPVWDIAILCGTIFSLTIFYVALASGILSPKTEEQDD